jgi:thioredoxin reductase
MMQEQRRNALSLLIFLKEKANGNIKSRTCINGAPQRAYIKKEDAASPTASTDSVFMIGAVNAHEERDVVTAVLPGAFLNTVTDELVFMVLKGELCN